MASLPRFSVLSQNFPKKDLVPTKQLLDAIGGRVRAELNDGVNTCAIRISDMLNRSGVPLVHTPGLYMLKGGKPAAGEAGGGRSASSLYLLRVGDMKKYLEKNFGKGTLIYDAMKDHASLTNIDRPTQGIVVFIWSGKYADFGATGHVDLLSVAPGAVACQGACYWWDKQGPMTAYLWPTAA